MKPILFPAGQTSFQTNGLGRLIDAISCTVTEERNGSYELHMEYPIDGALMDQITYSRIIYATPADNKNPQPFRIYRILFGNAAERAGISNPSMGYWKYW